MGARELNVTDGFSALLASDADHAVGTWNDYFIVIWRNETKMEAVEGMTKLFDEFAGQHPDGVGFVTIVERNAPLPPGSVRDALARFLGQATTIKGSGVVFEGSGFRASAVRSVVTGLTMLAKQPFPHKVFATVEQVTTWLVEEINRAMGSSTGADELLDGIRTLRRELDA